MRYSCSLYTKAVKQPELMLFVLSVLWMCVCVFEFAMLEACRSFTLQIIIIWCRSIISVCIRGEKKEHRHTKLIIITFVPHNSRRIFAHVHYCRKFTIFSFWIFFLMLLEINKHISKLVHNFCTVNRRESVEITLVSRSVAATASH